MAELSDLDMDVFEDDVYDLDNKDNDLVEDQVQNDFLDNTKDDDSSDEEPDILTEFLQSKGINPESVKMLNEDGETEEFNFNDLSREEQMQLLNYTPSQARLESPLASDLRDDEEQLLLILRQNNMSVRDYLNSYRNYVVQEYLASIPQPQEEEYFDVDQYSDEELFIADLKDKVPDLTLEEALQELELQQQNPELFQKKVNGLRASYQERERQVREYENRQAQQQLAQLAAQFELVIVDTIQNNGSIDLGDTSLELSEDDMNEIASFILDSDQAGVRHIAKALNDPNMLVEMAWWALKGHDALNQVTQYYKRQIAEARKEAKASAPRKKPTNVVSKPTKKTNTGQDFDLYDNLI